ncbi:MAG: oxidative damage protection protein [Candidatus Dasytiphilus stammeri]
MNRKRRIFCKYLQRQAEAQSKQFYPGYLGKMIYNHISMEAWLFWLEKQTILINEMKLNLLKIEDRNFLEKEMIKFLFKGKIPNA